MDNIKYIKRIDTTNKTNTYIDGQTIEFVLPKNKTDLSAFKIFFDVEIDPVYQYDDYSCLKRFMPRLSSSIIDTMTITKDGEVLQTIKDYNVIFNIINDATKEVDDIDSDRPDTLNYSLIDDDNNAKTICDFNNSTDRNVRTPLKYRCFISSFLGFLGEHSSSILDCSKHEYKIAITLAPKYITYRGIENTDVKVAFNGGGGSGAVAEVEFEKILTNISVETTVDNYNAPPAVTINSIDGNGNGANAVAEISGIVTAITITNQGDYTVRPTSINITGGGGNGATAIVCCGLSGILRVNQGTGYTTAPNITVSPPNIPGGTQATATCTIAANIINVITLTNQGSGYTSAPTVTFSGGGGSGATAIAVLGTSSIASVTVNNGGTGFTASFTSFITGGGGTDAQLWATVAGGVVTNIEVKRCGQGFTSMPTGITGGSGGSGLVVTIALSKPPNIKGYITNAGQDYTTPPTIEFVGGTYLTTQITAQSVIRGTVSKINITNYGSGYTSVPTVNIDADTTAIAVMKNAIKQVNITKTGSGYYSTPYVSFSGGDPEVVANAVAKINTVTGEVDSVVITDMGLGFNNKLGILNREYETNYNYKLTNVFANIDVVPDNTPASSQMTFKHYKTIKGTNNNTKNTTLSHIHKGKLNYLMASFVVLGQNDTGLQLNICNEDVKTFGEFFKENYGDIFAYEETPMTSKTASSKIAKNLSTENNLDNSLYFKRAGSNIKSSQFFVNGQAITPAMDIPQIYNVAKEFFNNDMSRVKSLASFENESFVFPMMINQTQEEYSSEIEWICSAGSRKDFNAYPILILCTDKTIEV